MALIQGRKKKEDDKQRVKLEEMRITGWLNFVVLLAMASVAYTDWVVVPNVSLGYLYVLPIALSAFINPLWVTVALSVASTVLHQGLARGSAIIRSPTVDVQEMCFRADPAPMHPDAGQRMRMIQDVR